MGGGSTGRRSAEAADRSVRSLAVRDTGPRGIGHTLCSGTTGTSPLGLLDDVHLVEKGASILCLSLHPAGGLVGDGDGSHGAGSVARGHTQSSRSG